MRACIVWVWSILYASDRYRVDRGLPSNQPWPGERHPAQRRAPSVSLASLNWLDGRHRQAFFAHAPHLPQSLQHNISGKLCYYDRHLGYLGSTYCDELIPWWGGYTAYVSHLFNHSVRCPPFPPLPVLFRFWCDRRIEAFLWTEAPTRGRHSSAL